MNQFREIDQVFFENQPYHIHIGKEPYPEQPFKDVREYNTGEGFLDVIYS